MQTPAQRRVPKVPVRFAVVATYLVLLMLELLAFC